MVLPISEAPRLGSRMSRGSYSSEFVKLFTSVCVCVERVEFIVTVFFLYLKFISYQVL